jgi:cbb3-type cytochrome oxidase subunit 3
MKGVIAFITVLFVIPLAHAVTMVALKMPQNTHMAMVAIVLIIATILIYMTKYIKSPAWETFTGMIAGVLLWAGLIEIATKLGAHEIDITERKALEFSLAILIPLFLYLVFNENIKCNLFISLRKGLRITREKLPDISIDHWGPRVAVKMFLLIWVGHLILFFGFDDDFFGPQGKYCKTVFIICLLGGSYLFYNLTKIKEMASAFRYAIPTVIVLWTCVELLVKWKIFSEPWLTLNPVFLTVLTIAFISIIILIVRTERRKKAA